MRDNLLNRSLHVNRASLRLDLIKRILIVGLGSIGQRHLRLARQMVPQADIRVLRHQATDSVPVGADGVFSRIDEAVAFAPQIAVVASPAPFHVATAEALALVGVHLLIEKPLSSSLTGVKKLLKTCEEHGSILMTGYNLRFLPSLQRFRDLLGEGVIGKTLSVRCEVGQYLPSWRPNNDYRQGVSAQQALGGGVLLELSHELDYLRWIFGEIDWVKASLCRQSSLEIDVEDTAHLTLGFSPRQEGWQLVAAVNLDFVRHDATRFCIAIGEKGSLRWNGLTGEVALYRSGATEWEVLFLKQPQRDESYLTEWGLFIDCVTKQIKPIVSGIDGMCVLEIIEAARLSATIGQKVSVNSMYQFEK